MDISRVEIDEIVIDGLKIFGCEEHQPPAVQSRSMSQLSRPKMFYMLAPPQNRKSILHHAPIYKMKHNSTVLYGIIRSFVEVWMGQFCDDLQQPRTSLLTRMLSSFRKMSPSVPQRNSKARRFSIAPNNFKASLAQKSFAVASMAPAHIPVRQDVIFGFWDDLGWFGMWACAQSLQVDRIW